MEMRGKCCVHLKVAVQHGFLILGLPPPSAQKSPAISMCFRVRKKERHNKKRDIALAVAILAVYFFLYLQSAHFPVPFIQ